MQHIESSFSLYMYPTADHSDSNNSPYISESARRLAETLSQWQAIFGNPAIAYIATVDSPQKLITDSDAAILYSLLSQMATSKHIDLILCSEGGSIAAARKLIYLLRAHASCVRVFIPARVRSAACLLALSANEMIFSPLGELGPIDPTLKKQADGNQSVPTGISSEEVRLYAEMAQVWFGMQSEDDRRRAFELLAGRFFPTHLSAFYRADCYAREQVSAALSFQLPGQPKETLDSLSKHFVSGYFDHGHGVFLPDVALLGLNARAASTDELRLMESFFSMASLFTDRNWKRSNGSAMCRSALLSSSLTSFEHMHIITNSANENGSAAVNSPPLGKWVRMFQTCS